MLSVSEEIRITGRAWFRMTILGGVDIWFADLHTVTDIANFGKGYLIDDDQVDFDLVLFGA